MDTNSTLVEKILSVLYIRGQMVVILPATGVVRFHGKSDVSLLEVCAGGEEERALYARVFAVVIRKK